MTWAYLHDPSNSSELSEAVMGALGFVVPLLFLVGATALCDRDRGCTSWIESVGMAFCFLGSGLGFVYRVMDSFNIVDAADRYSYLAKKGLPPYLFDWLPCLLVGLTLVAVAHFGTTGFRGRRWLLSALGLSGWLYHLSDVNGIIELRWAHGVLGVLFGCGWIVLGVTAQIEGIRKHPARR